MSKFKNDNLEEITEVDSPEVKRGKKGLNLM